MSYQEDYDAAALEMKAALDDFRAAEGRIIELQRRMAALVVLGANSPAQAEVERALKIIHATSKPADQLRRIFARVEGPRTIKELRKELREAGCDLSQQANPSGTIGALCARLVEQGLIRRTQKAGRIAWEKLL
jgi:thymidine phosphorylase